MTKTEILYKAKEAGIQLKIQFDEALRKKQIDSKTLKAQRKLDAQVLKDSNFYCPMDTGTLQKSAILNTVIGSGRIIWNTPYAVEQYYDRPNKSHDKNPNARMRWFEVAKTKKMNEWVKLVEDEYFGNT